ncbi:hypothetical protein BB560_004100 [Smittium megazygosporum]|uniref:BHLH domain-containing protein n=1 Tax=Smittium megazygosporum TaxID=133381 RepID=A0A2T9ZA88_9FUNG|nr:hypothetical protein BB560_004100 [Smittium megazygosporum]
MSSSDSNEQIDNVYTGKLTVSKRPKRKTSHSEIEKRRRQKINNALRQIQTLVPWLDDDCQYQKLEILEHAVNFIKILKNKKATSTPSQIDQFSAYNIPHLPYTPAPNYIVSNNPQPLGFSYPQSSPNISQDLASYKNCVYVPKKSLSQAPKNLPDNKSSENQMSLNFLTS